MPKSDSSSEMDHSEKPESPVVRIFGLVGVGQGLGQKNFVEFDANGFAKFDSKWLVPDVGKLVPGRSGSAVQLQGIMQAAQVSPSATDIVLHATTDNFHASVPLADVADHAVLIFAIDGKQVPQNLGGPFRFLIPDAKDCKTAVLDECANVKFVDSIEFRSDPGIDNRPQNETEHQKLHEQAEQKSGF